MFTNQETINEAENNLDYTMRLLGMDDDGGGDTTPTDDMPDGEQHPGSEEHKSKDGEEPYPDVKIVNDNRKGKSEQQNSGSPNGDTPANNSDILSKIEASIKQYGIEDYDLSEFKDKDIKPEDARKIVKDAIKYDTLRQIDPVAAAAVKNGVDINEYRNNVYAIQQELALPDVDLAKNQLYIKIWHDEKALGTLPADQQAAEQHVVQLTEAKAKQLGDAKISEFGKAIRAQRTQQLNDLPKAMQQHYAKEQAESIKRYNADVEAKILKTPEAKAVLEKGGMVPFTGKEEAADFTKYVKDMLTVPDGKNTTKLQEVLSDRGKLFSIMRALYLQEKGYYTKQGQQRQKAAFDALDDFEIPDGGGSNDKPTIGNGKNKPFSY